MIQRADEKVDGNAADSLHDALSELRRRPRHTWLDFARADQSDRWRCGQFVSAEQYFAKIPELLASPEEALVLICGEVRLRRERGEHPGLNEYQRRFPALAAELALQFDVDSILDDEPSTSLNDTSDELIAWEVPELPGYEFLEQLGSGAVGIVYRARQLSLGRDVAIKIVPLSASDPKRVARQTQEAEVLARLKHPDVVHVYEVIQHCGCMYLVMEYVDGPTLSEFAAGKPLQPDVAARLVRALADAMRVVHEAGVIHRDLKPANVLVVDGDQVRISDFGLAKTRTAESQLTTNDSVLGTPSYMSPEQAFGGAHSAGPETDVYSLGAILYELLTGRPPFLGATALETLAHIREQEPVPPRQLQPNTPRDLETICLHCLNKSPQNRYPTAGALAEDLGRYLAGKPIVARRSSHAERLVRWCRRNPAVAALTGAIALLLIAAVAILAAKNTSIRREAAAKDAALTTARQAVDQMLMRVANERLSNMPLGHPLRESLLQDALSFYEGLLSQASSDDHTVRESMADVFKPLGVLQRELGRCDDACRSFERSMEILQPMVATDPAPPAIREKLVASQEALAYTWQIHPRDSDQSDTHYRRTLQMYRDLERDFPERRQPVVLCLRRLADAAFHQGNLPEAERMWREAIASGEAYLEQQPHNMDARSNVCWSCKNLSEAILMRSAEGLAEAETLITKGLEHAAIVLDRQPRSSQARDVTAFLRLNLAQCYCSTNRVDDAIGVFHRAVNEAESLCAEFPWYQPHWNNAIYIHGSTVNSLRAAGRDDAARAMLDGMVAWIVKTAPQIPNESVPQTELRRCRAGLVALLHSMGQEQAAQELERFPLAVEHAPAPLR